MSFLCSDSLWTTHINNLSTTCGHRYLSGKKLSGQPHSSNFRPAKICSAKIYANRKSFKKSRRQREPPKDLPTQVNNSSSDEYGNLVNRSSTETDNAKGKNKESSSSSDLGVQSPSRSTVLQACTVTSGLIAALGIIIRQVSHVASAEGLPVLDCSTEISFGFEMWHLELIVAIVVLISSSRYVLLNTWSDFAESSEAANQQVLASLQPLDYLIVAFLPGLSEELLFRGALLPLFGINWQSASIVAALFGVLHLGSGRKYSFAVWAAFVGLVYGYATILTSSLVVPIASHAANNLVGGFIWRYSSKSTK